jgi:MFS family permease
MAGWRREDPSVARQMPVNTAEPVVRAAPVCPDRAAVAGWARPVPWSVATGYLRAIATACREQDGLATATPPLSRKQAMDDRTRTAEQPLTHAEARLIVIGMLVPVFMGAIDQTILASALPAIGREFGNIHDLPWLITTYLIASTATTPLFGKISDIRGRRYVIVISLIAHTIGSLICALSPNMTVLILGRILLGLGGGGLISTGMVVLGDIAPPKERARYYAYFSATYTTAGAVGPLLGGVFAEYMHWTFIFWFNVPLQVATALFTLRVMRRLPRHERPHKLDVAGAALVVLATAAFMFAITSGGVRYAWTSPTIIALLGAAAMFGGLFVWRLLTAAEPLVPLSILKNQVACCSIIANSFGWGAIIALNIFLPVYLQGVLHMSAAAAGLSLMVLMAVLNATAGFSSVGIARHRRYKILPIVGQVVCIGSVLVLAWRAGHMSVLGFEVLLTLIALGFGPLAPLTGVTLQNAVPAYQFGSAVGAMTFLRNLFATILVTVFGAIVLKGDTVAAESATFGYQIIFLMSAASLLVALIAMWVMEEKPLQTSHTR